MVRIKLCMRRRIIYVQFFVGLTNVFVKTGIDNNNNNCYAIRRTSGRNLYQVIDLVYLVEITRIPTAPEIQE